MAKTVFPYEITFSPVPSLNMGPYEAFGSAHTGTFHVSMCIYSGEQHTSATLLYKRDNMLDLVNLSDNEIEYQLWQMALDSAHAIESMGYGKAFLNGHVFSK